MSPLWTPVSKNASPIFFFMFLKAFGISSSQILKEMSKQTFTIHFILRNEKATLKGFIPIYSRIRLNGMKMEITTNRKVLQQDWSLETQLAHPVSKSLRELNKYLEEFKGKIYSAYTSILSRRENISTHLLKEEIFGVRMQKKYGLIETAKEHNEQFEKLIGVKYSYGSFKNYKTTLKFLKEFVSFQYKKSDMLFDKMDYKFCENYFFFLTTHKTCTTNGANKQLQRVKKIVNYAVKLGYISASPINSYSLHFKPVKRYPLSLAEINKLIDLDLQRKDIKGS